MAIALSQLLANLAPVVVSYRLPGDPVLAAVFGTTFVLARIPLFLFAPVQAVLLPKLTRAATLGAHDELARRLRQAVVLVAGIGLLGVIGCVVLGPWAAELLFNTAVRPTATTLALLGAATLVMMLALVIQPTLVAWAGSGWSRSPGRSAPWCSSALLVPPVAPIAAALVAQLVGPGVVLVVLSSGSCGPCARRTGQPGWTPVGDRLTTRPWTRRNLDRERPQ